MAQPTTGVLQRMFETGDFSDLTIFTAHREFKVHKAVVCPKWPAIREACGHEREASRYRVNDKEWTCKDDSAIGAILRHIYELPIKLPASADRAREGATDANIENELEVYLNVWQVGDEHHFPDLQWVKTGLTDCLAAFENPISLTWYSARVFHMDTESDEAPADEQVQNIAAELTVESMDRILNDADAQDGLFQSKEYVVAVFQTFNKMLKDKS